MMASSSATRTRIFGDSVTDLA